MLIGFLGAPCSGKTTTAAMTFADLKSSGIATEFIPEQARMYIAKKRWESGDPISLSDQDQMEIVWQQEQLENMVTHGLPHGIVITDSCVFNTLLYLSPEAKVSRKMEIVLEKAVNRYDLIFYCPPVETYRGSDPNRIHSYEQSLKLDLELPGILMKYASTLRVSCLLGDAQSRHFEATKRILELSWK